MSRVLIISNDYVRRAMAGPAIRNVELARQLARAGNDVTLAVPVSTDLEDLPFRLIPYDPGDPTTLAAPAARADVVVLQGWVLERNPSLRTTGARLVVDLYDPFPLEHLATVALDGRPEQFPPWEEVLGTLLRQVRVGDFFLCASERQRDLWLGMLLSLSRINAATYEQDPSLRSLVDVVPFGISDDPPRKHRPSMRGVIPGIGDGDFVLLWAGGVYNWFDPLTLIDAVAEVARAHRHLRLCFLAASHPNPEVPQMEMLTRARRRSDELGLTGRHVFFNEKWVRYEDRTDWLLEADAGVSTHPEHVETRFSFRTRILDYLWAGLPVVCTAGDSLADLIEREDAGLTVAAEETGALVQAIRALVDDPEGRPRRARNARTLGRTMTWERVAGPLLRYCAQPWPAVDLADLAVGDAVPVPLGPDTGRRPRLNGRSREVGDLARRALQILVEEGPASLARSVRRKLR
jgi:glycosyltransferase involved in cell wall biosynthesis